MWHGENTDMARDSTRQTSSQPTTLGEAIRQARKAAGLSSRQLAPLVGIHHSVLSRYECGEVTRPKPKVLQDIAEVTETDASALLAFLGVKATLPEPRVYFRKAYGMTDDEAEEAEATIAELRAKQHRSR
jgi:transcriptional regulator with XRE-family HTH domain